jgi:hypothetical protein
VEDSAELVEPLAGAPTLRPLGTVDLSPELLGREASKLSFFNPCRSAACTFMRFTALGSFSLLPLLVRGSSWPLAAK